MSLFDNPKNVGTLLIIIGVLNIILGIVASLFVTIDGGSVSFGMVSDIGIGRIMTIVGCVICAIIQILLGLDITNGVCRIQIGNFFSDVGSKYGILIALVTMCAITEILGGICSLIGGVGGIADIILGIIIFILAYVMADESKGIGKKIIWIILVVVFVVGLVVLLFSIIAIVTIPTFLLFLVLVAYIFSPEVKEKMGM